MNIGLPSPKLIRILGCCTAAVGLILALGALAWFKAFGMSDVALVSGIVRVTFALAVVGVVAVIVANSMDKSR